MDRVNFRLGKTEIRVNRNGFGALPIQRISEYEAVKLLHKAFDGGITYYDTARFYTDSETKLGIAFGGSLRQKVIIASKSMTSNANDFNRDLETTLRNLKTDYL
ncbi:MAG: aldo/keto reductase, partial [Tannerella sp.]|nr:aldo/keto reductase [Tannerella sp.]